MEARIFFKASFNCCSASYESMSIPGTNARAMMLSLTMRFTASLLPLTSKGINSFGISVGIIVVIMCLYLQTILCVYLPTASRLLGGAKQRITFLSFPWGCHFLDD